MKKIITGLLLLLYYSGTILSQTTNISGIINTYVQVTQLGSGPCIDSLFVTSSNGFNVNDTVLLIQMKGAAIDTTATTNFGTILNYNNAGNYEFGTVKSSASNIIVLNSGLTRLYNATASLQLVRVPGYVNAVVTGTLSAGTWNGTTGGILAFTASSSITLAANIDATGKGFQGGNASINYYSTWFNGYYCSVASGRGGSKGEGISTVLAYQAAGRGANSCGGGGGNDTNTGAGGGGNGGEGGHGGNNAFSSNLLWGRGGKALDQTVASNKIFPGGGGGGGHQNNSEGTNGGIGGGIVFIRTPQINGGGYTINANGTDITLAAGIDGAGGGGAGGSIILDVQTFSGNLNLNVKGGKGGDQFYLPQCHGNGGGGGGGVIKKTDLTPFPANVTINLLGGIRGSGQCNNTPNDAINGLAGTLVTGLVIPGVSTILAEAGPDQAVCPGTVVQIGVPAQPGLVYNWNNAAGTISNPVVSPMVTTTYILTVSQGSGLCAITDTDTVTVVVHPSPQAAFGYIVDCTGMVVTFLNNSSGGVSSLWNFGDGNSSVNNNPSHIYADTGTYTIELIVTSLNGCTDTLNQVVQLNPAPYPAAAFVTDTTACSLTVTFISNSLNATGLTWDFGDGNSGTQTNPVHTYATAGSYQVILVASNACGSDTTSMTLIIDTLILPVASFSFNSQQCNSTVQFTNTSQDAGSYSWIFGDGITSSQTNPLHNYNAPGVYQVTLIAFNDCGTDTLNMQVTIGIIDIPVSAFTPAFIPCDSTVTFTNTSQNSVSSYWFFGDGTTSTFENPSHIYSQPGTYMVMLISTNACGTDTIIIPVTLTAVAVSLADFNFEVQLCSSEVNFMNNSVNTVEWYWDFGDGTNSTIENPVHTFSFPGVYQVTLIVNPGTVCSDTVTITVPVVGVSLEDFFVPNVFTPNNDGKNDRFEIMNTSGCYNLKISIFNRWGQEIFFSDEINVNWDGKSSGTLVPAGVYYFVLEHLNNIVKGTLTVLR